MPVRISAELSHICPLHEVAAHADRLDSSCYSRV